MRLLLTLITALFISSCSTQPSANAKAEFKVWGNCKMCKKTIESAINKKEGVAQAEWNVKSKQITVAYDSTKISLKDIQQYIAAAGYDNEGLRGDDKAYAGLHECCRYDRAPLEGSTVSNDSLTVQ